jgi:hypothetical protein
VGTTHSESSASQSQASNQPLSFLGTMCRAEDQELSERRGVPSRNMASNSALAIASQSGASLLGRQVTGGPGIVRMWWMVLWRPSPRTPADRVRSGNSVRRLSTGVPILMILMLGVSELSGCAGEDNDMTPSSRRWFRQSTRRPKWERKSTSRSC